MKSMMHRMEGAAERTANFRALQALPYEVKVSKARIRVQEFLQAVEGQAYIAVGGLDSITLCIFIREKLGLDVPAISSSHLEDSSIQRIHKTLGVEPLKPLKKRDGSFWTKAEVIQQFGFPVLSKETAGKIALLQNPTSNNATVRHAIITGETGEYGGYRKNTRMKMSQKWLDKFGGYENETEGVNYQCPNFKVSDKCCYYLKEKPANDYARETGRWPIMGLMASEGGRREKALALNGCNYISPTTKRSAPFAIFTRQDILQLALDLNVPVPEIYGEIARNPDGALHTTKAQRTGCSMCGFGIHLEKRPHRFDRLYVQNPKEWEYWMLRCCTDEDTGETYGWGRVLDYIGVGWQQDEHQLMLEGL